MERAHAAAPSLQTKAIGSFCLVAEKGSEKMFCSEPVIRVYKGREEAAYPQGNSFFDCYHGISYHVTKGCRIVLETDHYFISLEATGVAIDAKTTTIEDYERPGEWLDSSIHDTPPFVDYEQTLFSGERLIKVSEQNGQFLLAFDDFSMHIVPHVSGDDVPGLWHRDNLRVYGCDRLLKKACSCGGHGELFLDHVNDYFVRCAKCKKATWSQMDVQDAIDEWNGGFLNWDSNNITIEND